MPNELEIVRDAATRLEKAGFAYMLTGSMAMNYYAQPRMTRDIDVVKNLAATGCDASYVDHWTRALGLFTLWKECQE